VVSEQVYPIICEISPRVNLRCVESDLIKITKALRAGVSKIIAEGRFKEVVSY
jgi:hypothetical protein